MHHNHDRRPPAADAPATALEAELAAIDDDASPMPAGVADLVRPGILVAITIDEDGAAVVESERPRWYVASALRRLADHLDR